MKKYNKKDRRIDAKAKVSGLEKYLNDYRIKDKLYATTIRSEKSHASITNISFDPDFNWSQITILSAIEIKNNYVSIVENDMPYLADKEVNYNGEPILLLAAKSRKKLKEARTKIKILYSPLSPILGINDLKGESEDKNFFKHLNITKGNFSEAEKKADLIIEEEFSTGYQEHVYLEPQTVMAVPEGKTIHIFGSLQCPYYVQKAMDELFQGTGIKTDVTQTPIGGAFGGKEDFPSLICGHVALLAHKTEKTVLLRYSRKEDIKYTTKRHPSRTKIKAAVNKDGKISGLKADITLDSGAYSTLSPVVLARAVLTFGCYAIENVQIDGWALRTNKVPCSAFRGFGGPQSLFATEMLIEKIAKKLNISPLKVRQKNMLKLGDKLATVQPINYSYGLPQCLGYVIEKSDFDKKFTEYKKFNKDKSKKVGIAKGIGVSLGMHGCGFTGSGENEMVSIAEMELIENGNIIIRTANTEMGQGLDTAFKRIVVDKLKIPFSDIVIEEKNTAKVPNSGPTVASRSTMIVGKLLVDNCDKILKKIKAMPPDKKASFSKLATKYHKKYGNLKVRTQYHHPDFIKFDEENYRGYSYPVYSWSASVAEVEIDLITFNVQVKNFYTSHDIGKAINHQQSEAQIEGGTIQGIGFALYENMTAPDGEIINNGFTDYIIPTTMDIPEIDTNIVEESYFYGPFGAKSLGELSLVGVPPAVAAAVSQAIGKIVKEIPITPEKIYKMMKKME